MSGFFVYSVRQGQHQMIGAGGADEDLVLAAESSSGSVGKEGHR